MGKRNRGWRNVQRKKMRKAKKKMKCLKNLWRNKQMKKSQKNKGRMKKEIYIVSYLLKYKIVEETESEKGKSEFRRINK